MPTNLLSPNAPIRDHQNAASLPCWPRGATLSSSWSAGTFPPPMRKDSGVGDTENWVDTARPRAGSGFSSGASGALKPPEPKFTAFTGAGNTLGGPGAAKPPAAAQGGGDEEAQLALALAMSRDLAGTERLKTRLPAEPADGATAARVAVRLPDGSRLNRRFPADSPLQSLVDFVCIELAQQAVGSGGYQIRSQYPPLKLTFTSDAAGDAQCQSLTMESAGLCPSAQLHVSAA